MARPIAKDHDAKRAQILTTAAKVFAREGYDRASMTQVAAACGISKANIYHYYANKDALLFGLLDGYLRELRDRVCLAPAAGLSAEQRLRMSVSVILEVYQGADDHHRVQMNGLGALPAEQQAILKDYQRDIVRHVSAIVHAIAPGQFGDDTAKLRAATMAIFGMLNWYYTWNSGAGPEAREAYAELVTSMALHGLPGV